MMSGYTKLFGSIVASTIWTEDDHTRIVWITMLAMANQHGEVEASIPGLAKFANTPLAATEAALKKLLAPDKYSRTKDHVGRRIEEVDGGWLILNHAKYRNKMNEDDQREKTRLRVAAHRERNASVTLCNDVVTDGNAGNDKQKQKQKQIQKQEEESFAQFWRAYPRRVAKGAAEKAWAKVMQKKIPLSEILAAIEQQKNSDQWKKDGGQFIPYPASWLNAERYLDEVQQPKKHNVPDHSKGF